MAQAIPASWRQALVDLRTDIQHAVERWLPIRKSDTQDDERERLPVRWREAVGQLRAEITEAVGKRQFCGVIDAGDPDPSGGDSPQSAVSRGAA